VSRPEQAALFPWSLGEVRASLATCPPAGFHVTGMRLERLGPDRWWGDLTGYREDLKAPFTWQGFRISRAPAGEEPAWRVALPPYLVDLDGPWRARLFATTQAIAEAVAGDPQRAAAHVVFVTLDTPPHVPAPGKVGGDRITPGDTFTAIWVHHAKRYRFAAELARDLKVLDLGCGVGYGSRMLARVARRVVGVDLSPEAVQHAARAYRSPRLRVLAADARRLPFAGGAFELVTCFEMIEHVEDHAAVLGEIARVLTPGGRLVVSTPNKIFYEDQPDPDHFHCGLLTLEEFEDHLRAHFGEVELWSQPRMAGLPEITDEFEVERGVHDGQEMFIAVASAPRRRTRAAGAAPARGATVAGAADTARPADGGRAAGGPRGGSMTVLCFNWHEPYLALLARAGVDLVVADWRRPWNARFRPLPAGARLCSDPGEASQLVADRRVDVVVCQTPDDLAWLGDRDVPALYLAHNSLPNEVRGREPGAADAVRALVRETLARRRGVFVAISDMKRESWGLDGLVIPPGIDVADHGGYTGETVAALTVGNLLRERTHMLGHVELEAALRGLPWRILGANPALGAAEAESFEALKAAYRAHRFYAHATLAPWEDGYNLALLEAMATGMPPVVWANPTGFVREGVDGFVAEDAETFRHWAVRLLDDADLARRVGERSRRSVAERFPLQAFAERWRAALEQAADRPLAARPAPAAPAPAATAPVAIRPAPPRPADATPRPAAPDATGQRAGGPRARRIVLASAWTPISTSVYYERALRAAGHEVLTWGPHMDEATLARWREATEAHALKPAGSAEEKIRLLRALTRPADLTAAAGQPSVRELLERLPRGWRPDLFVWIDGGASFLPLELERLDCPTACLLFDTHSQLEWRRDYARLFGHVFVGAVRQHVRVLEQAGCRDVRWLPVACDPDVHRAFDVPKAFDVVFVGQTGPWHPDRVRLLERLIAAGLDVHVTTRILEEMALAFGRGRIVFNRSIAGDINMRVFEALASGSLLLTDRLAPESGFDELLTDRVHVVCYGEDDLEALARHYLEHPEEREAIARAGRDHVRAHHTYRHRARALLAAVLGEEAAGDEPRSGAAATPPTAAVAGPVDEASLPAYYRNERPEIAALVPAGARRVLEVGCAAGALGRLLKRRAPREVVGIEIHAPAAAVARRHLDRVLELDLDAIDALPLDEGSFDCIVCADVLEHLRAPERALAVLRRYLAPGGVLIASIPNVRHASVVLPLLVEGRWQYRDEGILDRTHLRFFTAAEIVALFEGAGFRARLAGATKSAEHPVVPALAEVVGRLGGDAAAFREDSAIVQYVVVADAPPAPAAAEPASRPDVSIVIPVFNRAEFTARCLAALAETVDAGRVEVIVVDNASSDATAAVLGAAPLPVRVLRNDENLGFARACNQGARAARGGLLVFLNNDTEPEPGWLEALERAAAEPGVGIVGARLLYPGTRRVQHAGLALTEQGVPDHLWRSLPEDDPRVVEPRDVDMVTGACLAVARERFLALGGFDEAYVNGVEDVDLCLAARAAGLRVRYESRAVVLHHEGASEGRFAHAGQNLRRFVEKWADRLAAMERRPASDFGTMPGPTVAWEGSFFLHHSLAGVNRALCRELSALGVDLALARFEADEFAPEEPADRRLARLIDRPTKTPPAVRVRHRFPPDFSRRPGERLVVMQPWEFGTVPREWVRAINENVDELWVLSEWVRQSFIRGGVPADRVVTIHHGFDPAVFRPDATPLPLPTTKRFRFLYVGGSIYRKGYDVLLRAYAEEFSAADDVCLVVKDHAYYGHRLDEALGPLRARPGAPEILYYFDSVKPAQMAGFYAAASCLVHPFRGEGFGLPVLEAMACGRPVIVTDAGPVREFCPDDAGLFVPAATLRFPEDRVDHLETVGTPWLAEPDLGALRRAMRRAYEQPEDCRRRGERAAAHAHAHFTWARLAPRYVERLAALTSAAPPPPRPAAGATATTTATGAELQRALAAVEAGDLRSAVRIFSAIVKADPRNVPALLGAAQCALGLDEVRVARALLARVLAVEPDHAGARRALAELDDVPVGARP